jgi:hypothetical protein
MVLDRMIGFLGAALKLLLIAYNHITDHNRRLSKAPYVSFLNHERLLFHGGQLINFLAVD